MAYISKITRTYSFKGEIVQLQEGKEIAEDFVNKFPPEAITKYFEQTPEKSVKPSKKGKAENEVEE